MKRRPLWLCAAALALALAGCGRRSIGFVTGAGGGAGAGSGGSGGTLVASAGAGGVGGAAATGGAGGAGTAGATNAGGSGGTAGASGAADAGGTAGIAGLGGASSGGSGAGGIGGIGGASGSAGGAGAGGTSGVPGLAGSGGMSGAAGSSTAGAGGDVPGPFEGVLAGRVTMDGSVDAGTVSGAGVAGVTVSLTGPAARTAVTDANGAYRFVGLPAGSYTVTVAKSGAAFAATLAQGIAVAGQGPGTIQSFACAAPCGDGPAIDPARELIIEDPSVLGDARTDNASDGVWSFRFLMEQIGPPMANAFVEQWLADLAATGRDVTRLRAQWPTVDENGQQLPDLSRAPFQLLAIVNRIDAYENGNGELRFVYGLKNVPGAPELHGQALSLTAAFHFRLPSTGALPDRAAWARKIHELGAVPFDGGAFAAKLQELTDLVARAYAVHSSQDNPRGNTFAVLRINDGFTSGPGTEGWQLREFRASFDQVSGYLQLLPTPTHQTPDSSLNGSDGALPDFLKANAALVQAGAAALPSTLLGTKSTLLAQSPRWSFPTLTDESLRHAFGGQTCVGCHGTEVGTGTTIQFHISPFNGPVAQNYSGLIPIQEIPRRVSFMQNLLTCQPPLCAAGGEEMMRP
jgi:hypothetical protein